MILSLGRLTQQLLKWYCASSYRSFKAATTDPYSAQKAIFEKIILHLSQSAYGKHYGMTRLTDYVQFSKQLPIVNYDDISDWIHQSEVEKYILTDESIDFYEYTSGSQGNKKRIPYTPSLRKDFSEAFKIWSYDCFQSRLTLSSGRTFMSISPLPSSTQKEQHNLQDDSDYLQGLLKPLVRHFLVSQPQLYQLSSSEHFRWILALTLLSETKLEIISIWNPTYLLGLLELIECQWTNLLKTLNEKVVTLEGIEFKLKFSKKRKAYLHALPHPLNWETVWPNLKMISCWTSGTASRSAMQLGKLFPDTFIQGKGLMATEAPLTIPIISAAGCLPLLQSVFFEFEDNQKKLYRLHELQLGQTYEVIITQRGGLYRYRLGDLVQVTHFYQSTPCLSFIARKQVSDLVGEKLSEAFVTRILNQPPFESAHTIVLVPEILNTGQGRYHLLTDEASLADYANILDEALCHAFHYQNARRMMQLDTPQVHVFTKLHECITDFLLKKGISLGDQKVPCLITQGEIAQHLIAQVSSHTLRSNKV